MYSKTVGVVCDLSYTRSICMIRFYEALRNIFQNVLVVNNIEDLKNINLLFICDPFFPNHRIIWNKNEFIENCNLNNISVVVYYGEKIINFVYPDNLDLFNKILSFNNLNYYVWDADDSTSFNKKVLRYCPSKYYEDKIPKVEKLNKCIFIGQINTHHYGERRAALSKINNYIETDILENFNGDWKDYLKLYSRYKYSFCPISGNYNGLPLRFYEALLVDCIPIQQVRKNTLNVYSAESNFNDCVFFENIEEVPDKLSNINIERSTNKVWLEDELLKVLIEDKII